MEADQEPAPFRPKLRTVELGEWCYLARRRSGKTLRAVASEFGVCKWQLIKMESGLTSCTRLLAWWQEQGMLGS